MTKPDSSLTEQGSRRTSVAADYEQLDVDYEKLYVDLFRLLEPGADSVKEAVQQCRLRLVKFFAWRHCVDPEDLADDTISRLLKSISDGTEIVSEKPYSFVYGIAINVFKEDLRERTKHPEVVNIDDIVEIADSTTMDECQKYCLEQLSNGKRQLLRRYYLEKTRCEDIAREQELTINALRLKIFNIKKGLRRCYDICRNQSVQKRN